MDEGDTLRMPEYLVGYGAQGDAANAANGYKTPQVLDNSFGFTGLVNAVTGVLSKTVETAEDYLAMQGAQKIVGATYPSGQNDPSKQISQNTAVKTVNYTPWIIGGAAVVGLVVLVAVMSRK